MPAQVLVALPEWAETVVGGAQSYASDAEKMRLVIGLAGENVARGTGGPFGAAVFERESGRVVGIGVNGVVRASNAMLHAEIVACMMAQHHVGSYSLSAPGLPAHELATSCEPCAMCLGAILWSGVRRVIVGASRDDARAIGFDEGPVFPDSFRYLEARGIEFVYGVLRAEAAAVLETYGQRGGEIYNA